MTTAFHCPPSILPPFQTDIETTLIPLQMSTGSSPRDVDPIADTTLIYWDGIDSHYSGQKASAVEADGAINTEAEREIQATHSEALCREGDGKKS